MQTRYNFPRSRYTPRKRCENENDVPTVLGFTSPAIRKNIFERHEVLNSRDPLPNKAVSLNKTVSRYKAVIIA